MEQLKERLESTRRALESLEEALVMQARGFRIANFELRNLSETGDVGQMTGDEDKRHRAQAIEQMSERQRAASGPEGGQSSEVREQSCRLQPLAG